MVFVGYNQKLNVKKALKIEHDKDDDFVFNKNPICWFEICGVIMEDGSGVFNLLDFTGELNIFKSKNLVTEKCKGSCVLMVKPFVDKTGRIQFYCKQIRESSFYEEIAFNIEIMSLDTLLHR